MNTTSATLLQHLRSPNPREAWSRFVDLYTPLLLYWTRKSGLSEADAADVVQDILVMLLEKMPAFVYNPDLSFRTWLCTLTRNKCREHHRRQHVRRGEPLPDLPDPAQEDPAEVAAEEDYRRHVLNRALELMEHEFQPTTWRACREHVIQGRGAQEVAAELGISVNAVYLAKSRVLRRLRQELDGLLD